MTGRRRPASGATLTATLTAAVALALLGAAPAAAQDAATVVSASERTGPPPTLSFFALAPRRAVDTRNPSLGGPIPVAAGSDQRRSVGPTSA